MYQLNIQSSYVSTKFSINPLANLSINQSISLRRAITGHLFGGPADLEHEGHDDHHQDHQNNDEHNDDDDDDADRVQIWRKKQQ